MNFKMVLFIAVLVIIGTLNLWGQKPTEEDPYLLWQTTDPLGYSGFLIHPNGNIIANRNCEFFEIDGNTGALLKTYPVHYGYSDIESVTLSPDGKYFAAIYWGSDSGTTFIFDCQTGEVFRKFPRMGDNIRFMPDSKHILLTTFYHETEDKSLQLYNIEDESFQFYGPGFKSEFLEYLGMSEDGRYFATGGRKKEQVGLEEKTFVYFRLWDAQTLKPIKQLDKIEGDNEVRSIKFSSDGKYVGFQVGIPDFYIYKLNDLSFLKLYNNTNIEFLPLSFCFLPNENITFTSFPSNGVTRDRFLVIKNIENDKIIFRYLKEHGNGFPPIQLSFNSLKNSIILAAANLFSFDLTNIITSVHEPKSLEKISSQYKKGILTIRNLNLISNQINITISDLTGRVIRKLDSPVGNSEIRIPLKLQNGTYLLHIQDGNKEYSSKFLVAE